MNILNTLRGMAVVALVTVGFSVGCNGVDLSNLDLDLDLGIDLGDLGDIGDIGDIGGDNGIELDAITLDDFATDTDGGSGIALRPSDGALFMVNTDGLFGPIEEGGDISTMEPFGAENMADEAIFDEPRTAFVLAITESGEFWIGSPCCSIMAVVPAGGGDAEPFAGLLGGEDINIKVETLAFVPDGFDGAQMQPGNLLAGEDTRFSALGAIDTEDRTAVSVDNPLVADDGLNREAHHLAFGADGTLFSSLAVSSSTIAGIQTIATDGTPTALEGTFRVAAHSFVGLDNGDLLVRGSFGPAGDTFRGLFFWVADSQELVPGVALAVADISENDELVIASDGTVYLSLPRLNKIVKVTDNR